jgi:hypothetical protein
MALSGPSAVAVGRPHEGAAVSSKTHWVSQRRTQGVSGFVMLNASGFQRTRRSPRLRSPCRRPPWLYARALSQRACEVAIGLQTLRRSNVHNRQRPPNPIRSAAGQLHLHDVKQRDLSVRHSSFLATSSGFKRFPHSPSSRAKPVANSLLTGKITGNFVVPRRCRYMETRRQRATVETGNF